MIPMKLMSLIDIEDLDSDNDGVSDRFDNCPDTPEDSTVDLTVVRFHTAIRQQQSLGY